MGLSDVEVDFETEQDTVDSEKLFEEFCSRITAPDYQDMFSDKGSSSSQRPTKKPRRSKKSKKSLAADDIRKHYAAIFVRTCNDANHNALLRVLEKYCISEVELIAKDVGKLRPVIAPDTIPVFRMVSRQQISDFMKVYFTAVPDAVFKLHEAKLYVRKDQTSYLVCGISYTGFKLYPVDSKVDSNMEGSSSSSGYFNNISSESSTLELVGKKKKEGSSIQLNTLSISSFDNTETNEKHLSMKQIKEKEHMKNDLINQGDLVDNKKLDSNDMGNSRLLGCSEDEEEAENSKISVGRLVFQPSKTFENPIAISVIATIIYEIDKDHKITKIDITHKRNV